MCMYGIERDVWAGRGHNYSNLQINYNFTNLVCMHGVGSAVWAGVGGGILGLWILLLLYIYYSDMFQSMNT